MTFTILPAALKSMLDAASLSISTKAITPILGCALFTITPTTEGRATLSIYGSDKASSLDIQTEINAPAAASFAADAATFKKVLSVLGGTESITITIQPNKLQLKHRNSVFNITTLSSGEYPPPIKAEGSKQFFQISANALKTLMQRTIHSIAADDNRYGLNGLHISSEDGLSLVSTDGNRLTIASHTDQILFDNCMPRNTLLPRHLVHMLCSLLPADNTICDVSFAERSMAFTWGNIRLTGRLLEAAFPSYKEVMSPMSRRMYEFVVDRQELQQAVRRVSIFATGDAIRLQLIPEQNQIILNTNSINGSSREECSMQSECGAEPMVFGLNRTFLNDALASHSSESVRLRINGSLSPLEIGGPDDDIHTFKRDLNIVMPVRLD